MPKTKTAANASSPLRWPANWPRTRPQDQRANAAWRLTMPQYQTALRKEFERMGAPSFDVTTNAAPSRDVGVAVYFSRPTPEDYTWQDALGITDPYPTEEQVSTAWKLKAAPHHPDRVGGDVELFHVLTKHRDNAIRWIRQQEGRQLDYVIACDTFRETKLNLAAIVLTIRALRQIERCGTSTLLEQAFKGFAALPEARP